MPTSFLNDWTNVIHLTVDGDSTNYGDRISGLWFQPDNYFCFSSAINSLTENVSVSTVTAPLMEWTKVRISQLLIDEEYIFTVQIAENEVYTRQNTLPKEFKNVKVYLGDPWYNAQPGFIRNFIISNICEGNFYITFFKQLFK